MLKAELVALYFLNKDKEHELFKANPEDLISKNGRKFYASNARLQKYLHIAQNVYIAMTGEKLFEDDLYAYDNGAVVPVIQENYQLFLKKAPTFTEKLDNKISKYLDKIYVALKYANVDELIELSHEDLEWYDKNKFHDNKQSQRMDSLKYKDFYKKQYKNFIWGLERISGDD